MDLSHANLAECLPIVATIDPNINTAAKTTGDVIDMSKFHAVLLIFQTSDIGSVTIDGGFESSAASNMGTPGQGAALTQVGASATANDNAQFVVFQRADTLTEGHRYVRPYVTPGAGIGAAAAISAVVLGVPRFQPGDATVPDLATVIQIVK